MRLGSTVPDFKADSTQGPIHFHDYIGDSWCVLFSHPADFTPVCTTELGLMAIYKDAFKRRGVKVIALSCDKLTCHMQWVDDIKTYCPDIFGEYPFPIISDESRQLAILLDMLDEDDKENEVSGITIRAVYIISPDKKLRLSLLYPTSTGRNIDEILRCIDSLQLVDRVNVIATPSDWLPGTKVMILPAVPDEQLPKLFPRGVEKISMPSGKVYIRITYCENF